MLHLACCTWENVLTMHRQMNVKFPDIFVQDPKSSTMLSLLYI
jgi:hypothetical protein